MSLSLPSYCFPRGFGAVLDPRVFAGCQVSALACVLRGLSGFWPLLAFISLRPKEPIQTTCLLSFVSIWTLARVKLSSVLFLCCCWIQGLALLYVHAEMCRSGFSFVLYGSLFSFLCLCNEIMMKWSPLPGVALPFPSCVIQFQNPLSSPSSCRIHLCSTSSPLSLQLLAALVFLLLFF